jgi:hypothetical protein
LVAAITTPAYASAVAATAAAGSEHAQQYTSSDRLKRSINKTLF